MDPKLNRDKWLIDDSKKLFALHRKFKNRWKNIAEMFPGRTDNSIKNQFFSLVRKALRKACKLLGIISNTRTINKIKPKILANYLLMEIDINVNGGFDTRVRISLNEFIQKFAFTRYNEVAQSTTKDDLSIIRECIDYLYRINDDYIENKNSKRYGGKFMIIEKTCEKMDEKIKCGSDRGASSETSPVNRSRCESPIHINDHINSIKCISRNSELSQKLQSLLADIQKFQSEEQINEKLIDYFKTLGNFSFMIAEALSSKEKMDKKHVIDTITRSPMIYNPAKCLNLIENTKKISDAEEINKNIIFSLDKKIIKIPKSFNDNLKPSSRKAIIKNVPPHIFTVDSFRSIETPNALKKINIPEPDTNHNDLGMIIEDTNNLEPLSNPLNVIKKPDNFPTALLENKIRPESENEILARLFSNGKTSNKLSELKNECRVEKVLPFGHKSGFMKYKDDENLLPKSNE